jgi:hypothetical protein
MSVLKKVATLLIGDNNTSSVNWLKMPKKRALKKLTERELLTLESEVGAKLFGPIPKGHRREFFCLDERTWIWHEEWFDEKHKLTTSTVRYEINEHGVLKVQEGARYTYIDGEELQNFGIAIRMYYEQVAREVYSRDPATGESLVQ